MSSSHHGHGQSYNGHSQPQGVSSTRKRMRALPTDIICGRGFHIVNHRGNLNLHLMVNDHRAEYSTSRRSKKTKITKSILAEIKETGARFIRKVASDGRSHADEWEEVDYMTAYKKVSHALRLRTTNESNRDDGPISAGAPTQQDIGNFMDESGQSGFMKMPEVPPGAASGVSAAAPDEKPAASGPTSSSSPASDEKPAASGPTSSSPAPDEKAAAPAPTLSSPAPDEDSAASGSSSPDEDEKSAASDSSSSSQDEDEESAASDSSSSSRDEDEKSAASDSSSSSRDEDEKSAASDSSSSSRDEDEKSAASDSSSSAPDEKPAASKNAIHIL